MHKIKEKIRRGLRWGALVIILGTLALGLAVGGNLQNGRLADSPPGEFPWQLSQAPSSPGEFPWQL